MFTKIDDDTVRFNSKNGTGAAVYKFALTSGLVACYLKVEHSGACSRFGVVDHDLNKTRSFADLLGNQKSDVWWDYGGTCHYFTPGSLSEAKMTKDQLAERNVQAGDLLGWRLDADKQIVEYNVNGTGWKTVFMLKEKKNWTVGLSISSSSGGTSFLFSRNPFWK